MIIVDTCVVMNNNYHYIHVTRYMLDGYVNLFPMKIAFPAVVADLKFCNEHSSVTGDLI